MKKQTRGNVVSTSATHSVMRVGRPRNHSPLSPNMLRSRNGGQQFQGLVEGDSKYPAEMHSADAKTSTFIQNSTDSLCDELDVVDLPLVSV